MAPVFSVFTVIAAIVIALAAGPARASGDRDALSDETIGLMIDNSGPGQAEALLGVLYLRGMRIESDPIAASAWLDRAARAGHPAGIYGAARMHADGIGVPVDTGRARQILGDADPARFGALADAVRRLRRELGLPDELSATVPKPDHDAVKTPPATPLPDPASVTPPSPPPAAAEPPMQPGPAATTTVAIADAASPAKPEATERPRAEPARAGQVQLEPAPASPPAATAESTRDAVATEAASTPPVALPAPTEPTAAVASPPADAIAGPFAQLATLFSEASTASELARIRGIVPPSLLQGHELSVRTVKLGDGRTAWRIVATGFAHRDDARIFCGLVAASGLGCLPRQ